MRNLAILVTVVVLAGCSATPPEGSSRARATTERIRDGEIRVTPMVGANVEDARNPGVLYCASCGSKTDRNGSCPCNGMGMPSYGIQATSRQKRSTTLGINPDEPPRRTTAPR